MMNNLSMYSNSFNEFTSSTTISHTRTHDPKIKFVITCLREKIKIHEFGL